VDQGHAGELLRVTTSTPAYGGYALARTERTGVLFVRWALPGETVDVRLGPRKRDYGFAEALEILTASPHRVRPPCEVFGICGGCQLQHATYPYQLEMKREILCEAFRRIAGRDVAPDTAPPGEPFGYRYRGQFKTDGREVGLFAERSRRLVPVSRCPLMAEPINRALPSFRGLGRIASVAEVHLVTDGAHVWAWLPGTRHSDRLVSHLSGHAGETLAGLRFEDRGAGEESVTLPLCGFSYSVSPRGFFQANWRMNQALLEKILSSLGSVASARLLDLYAGAGNFALPLSTRFREVVAVEGEPEGVEGLRRNVRENRIGNVVPVRSRVEAYRPDGPFEVLLVDPPRSGLSAGALATVRRADAGRIFYVSCNPSTLARDTRALSDRYDLSSLEMYDFFPNTHHIETLAVLSARRARP
jgi:23S rRNA (uracil1939-C5)-methyltransferase